MKLNELDLEKPLRPTKVGAAEYTDTLRMAVGDSPWANPDSKKRTKLAKAGASNRAKDKLKFQGSGFYSQVYDRPQKANTVVKIGKVIKGTPPSDDAYLRFLHGIEDHENPYLPKIHNVRLFKTKDDRVLYKVSMERLREIGSISPEQAQAMQRKMFGTTKFPAPYSNLLQVSDLEKIVLLIAEFVESPDSLTKFGYTNADPQFVEAIKILNHIYRSGRATNDISLSNVMYRYTLHGPQLVIIDPFS